MRTVIFSRRVLAGLEKSTRSSGRRSRPAWQIGSISASSSRTSDQVSAVVVAPGNRPPIPPVIAAHVEIHGAVGKLHRRALVHLPLDRPADVPGDAMIIAVDDMRAEVFVLRVRLAHAVIAGDQQPAAGKLDAVPRPSGVPGPVRRLHLAGDLDRGRPRHAVVIAPQQPHAARRLAAHDLALGAFGQVPVDRQPDRACGAILDGARVAEHVRPGVGDELHLAPRFAVVHAAPQHDVDIAGIGRTIPAALAKRKDRARRCHQERWDAVGVIAALPGHEEVGLVQIRCRRGAHAASSRSANGLASVKVSSAHMPPHCRGRRRVKARHTAASRRSGSGG